MNKKSGTRTPKCYRVILLVSMIIFIVLSINEYIIQPYRSQKVVNFERQLYTVTNDNTHTNPPNQTSSLDTSKQNTKKKSSFGRDQKGRLLQFQELLALNDDVKGWITIQDTNIDYVVMQSEKENPEYYLSRNLQKEKDKSGSLFLDYKSSVEDNTKNLVIHGHNMTSTDNMFHYLLSYKQLNYYKSRPVINFDTIYQTGKWKIFAIIISNGSSKKEKLFDYTKADFANSSEFLNFVYQLRVRSIYNIDTVDVNENDQLLTLSTCSYEIENYRTAIIARRIREGEDDDVDVDSVTINKHPLYPQSWYEHYGGEAPKVSTFENALQAGKIKWYNSVDKSDKEE